MADIVNDNNAFFKEKIELLEKQLLSLQIDNTKKASEIKKYQDDLSKFHSTTNNTSSQYPLASTFIQQWENFSIGTIMDTFEHIYDNCELIAVLIRVIFINVNQECKRQLNIKLNQLTKFLGIKEEINQDLLHFFFMKFKVIIFQDYFNTFFICDDSFIDIIIAQTKREINDCCEMDFIRKRYADIMNDIESIEMKKMINEAFEINMYMIVHEPPLFVEFEENSHFSYRYYDKNEHVNIEGFPNDNSPCVVILPPPLLKRGIVFQGIKPSVYICNNPTEDIINECNSKEILEIENNAKKLCKSQINSLGSFDASIDPNEISRLNSNEDILNNSLDKEKALIQQRSKRNKKKRQIFTTINRKKNPKKCSLYCNIIKKSKSNTNNQLSTEIVNIISSKANTLSSTFSFIRGLEDNQKLKAWLSKHNKIQEPKEISKDKEKPKGKGLKKKSSYNKDLCLRSISNKNMVLNKCKGYVERLQSEEQYKQTDNNMIQYPIKTVISSNTSIGEDNPKVNCQTKTPLILGTKKAIFDDLNNKNDHNYLGSKNINLNTILITNSNKRKMLNDASYKALNNRIDSNGNIQRIMNQLNNGTTLLTKQGSKKTFVSNSYRNQDKYTSKPGQGIKKELKQISPTVTITIEHAQHNHNIKSPYSKKHCKYDTGSSKQTEANCESHYSKSEMQFNGIRKVVHTYMN